jgi:hypothetical protein
MPYTLTNTQIGFAMAVDHFMANALMETLMGLLTTWMSAVSADFMERLLNPGTLVTLRRAGINEQ